MLQDTVGFTIQEIQEGQVRLAWVMKTLVDRRAPGLFERLDLNDDFVFLEPLLFAFFNDPRPRLGLEQLLFGYLEEDARPDEIPVRTVGDGLVHLPGLGVLRTAAPDRDLRLCWDRSASTLALYSRADVVPHSAVDRAFVPGTEVELRAFQQLLLAPCFTDSTGALVQVEIPKVTARHAQHLATAMDVVRTHCPEYYEEIATVARAVVVFEHADVRPFATMSAHGTAFLSAGRALDEVFFVAEIVHQFGHNILNAALFDIEAFLRVDPRTPVREFTRDASDARTVLSAFHGLYTTTKTAECLGRLYQAGVFRGRKGHDLLGRLADNQDRVTTGLEQIDRSLLLTPRGERMFYRMKEICCDIYARLAPNVGPLDTSDQPFVFDYERFAARNPMPGATR